MKNLPTYHLWIMMEDTVDWFTQHPFFPQTGTTSCKAKRLLKPLKVTVPKSDLSSVNWGGLEQDPEGRASTQTTLWLAGSYGAQGFLDTVHCPIISFVDARRLDGSTY